VGGRASPGGDDGGKGGASEIGASEASDYGLLEPPRSKAFYSASEARTLDSKGGAGGL
jgi:hypothetical protein